MSTTVLAYVILLMGFITFLGGLFGALTLIFEEVAKTGHVPFRYYAMMVGLISGGLAMIGIGQGLRLLLLILGKGSQPGPTSACCSPVSQSGRHSKLGAFGLRSEAGCAQPRLPWLESLLSFCTGCGSKVPTSSGHQRRPLINLHSRTTEFPLTNESQKLASNCASWASPLARPGRSGGSSGRTGPVRHRRSPRARRPGPPRGP